MRRLILASPLLLLAGCDDTPGAVLKPNQPALVSGFVKLRTVDHDGCEYVVATIFDKGCSASHKGNCRFCATREKEVKP